MILWQINHSIIASLLKFSFIIIILWTYFYFEAMKFWMRPTFNLRVYQFIFSICIVVQFTPTKTISFSKPNIQNVTCTARASGELWKRLNSVLTLRRNGKKVLIKTTQPGITSRAAHWWLWLKNNYFWNSQWSTNALRNNYCSEPTELYADEEYTSMAITIFTIQGKCVILNSVLF